MDRSGISGGPRRALPIVLGLLVLLAAVTIASTGRTPSGSDGASRPSQWLVDVLTSLFLVFMSLGTVLLLVLVVLRPREVLEALAPPERRRGRAVTAASLIVLALLLALAARRFADAGARGEGPPAVGGDTPFSGSQGGADRYEPHFATGAVVVTLIVVAVGVVAALLAARRLGAGRTPETAELKTALADVLDEALDDLRAEQDPRRAVIAAYARLERVFAFYGVPRRPSEAPEEYLVRVLAGLDVPERAARRLTELFATAKFSQHDVEVTMKEEAIEALRTARDELRRTAEVAELERAAALASARERAAR